MPIHRFEEELLRATRQFLDAAEANPESCAILDQHGFGGGERARGRELCTNTERSFAAERAGVAWNFQSRTPGARRREAIGWFVATRTRRFRRGFAAAETALASSSPLGAKVARAAGAMLPFLSPITLLEDQRTLARDLVRAGGEQPDGTPPPKDATLVELQGWYEHWKLLAHRVFRGRPDLLAPYGLVPGKAPPRLRGREARERYGEGAAGTLPAGRLPVLQAD